MNANAVKQLKKPKLWLAFVLISLFVWVIAFYWIAQPSRSEKFEIWLGAEFDLKSELKEDVREAAKPHGIKKCTFATYNPDDTYYAQAFALRANSVDIYILTEDMAVTIAETGIFSPLSSDFGGGEFLTIGEEDCGVRFTGDYYIFVNSKSKKDKSLLYDVITVLLNGAKV